MPKKEAAEITWAEHPLFPAEDGDDPPAISFIQISRYESNGSVLIPRVFTSAELTSEAQIGEMFGGGLYELIGRRSSKLDPASMGNITRKRRIRLPGVSTPLAPEAPAAAPPEAPSAPSGGLAMSDNIIIAMMQMQSNAATAQAQAQAQIAQAQATAQAQSQQQSQQMMITMVQTMMSVSQQQTSSMATMMTALLGSRGGGPDELVKYAELFKSLTGKPAVPGDEPEKGVDVAKLFEDGADIVAGLVELKKGAGGASGAPPAEMG
jgi:hypothetical protein